MDIVSILAHISQGHLQADVIKKLFVALNSVKNFSSSDEFINIVLDGVWVIDQLIDVPSCEFGIEQLRRSHVAKVVIDVG